MSPSIRHALRKGFTWRDAVAAACVPAVLVMLLAVRAMVS